MYLNDAMINLLYRLKYILPRICIVNYENKKTNYFIICLYVCTCIISLYCGFLRQIKNIIIIRNKNQCLRKWLVFFSQKITSWPKK